jgi:8-oxo-dGTP diphosphatase
MNIDTIVNIFTIINGDIKILLFKKSTEPYKGYWTLPTSSLSKTDDIDNVITSLIIDNVGLSNLWLEQNYTFANIDRGYDSRVISISYLGLIDSVSINIKMKDTGIEKEWFKITELPKLAFDNDKVINKAIETLKTKIANTSILKLLFPSDFTLPELQKVLQNLLNIEIDRRNFRKKLLDLNLIEETGDINDGGTGRPAKLYRFKDNIKNRNILNL